MEAADVCYANNKTGTYVQFRLEVFTNDLSELNAYSKFLMKSIQKDFHVLFDVYGMSFTTDSAYITPSEHGMYLAVCLLGETTPELEETLQRNGIERRGFEPVGKRTE